MSDRSQFTDQELPPLQMWINTLNNEKYQSAASNWKKQLSGLVSESGCCIACVLLRVLSKVELPNQQDRFSPILYSFKHSKGRCTENYESTSGVNDGTGTLTNDRAISEGQHDLYLRRNTSKRIIDICPG